MTTPSEELASNIAERLVAESLVTPARMQELARKIIDGSVTGEDWKLAVDLSEPQGEKE